MDLLRRLRSAVAAVALLTALGAAALAAGQTGGHGGGDARVSTRDFGTQPATYATVQSSYRDADGSTMILGAQDSGFVVARLNPDGTLDQRFGNGGKVVGAFGIGVGEPVTADIAPAPGGKFIVGGDGPEAGEVVGTFAFTRYLPDGRRDPSFGDGGNVVFGGSPPVDFGVEEMVVLHDGDIFAVGRANIRPRDEEEVVEAVLVKPDGSIDRSYGHKGFLTVPVPESNYGSAMQVRLDPKGRPIVFYGKEDGFRLIGFKPNGDLDRAYGKDGVVEVPAVAERYSGTVGMTIGPEGKILVAGPEEVAEVEPDGKVDTFKVSLPESLEGTSLKGRPALDSAGRVLLSGETPVRKEVDQGIVVRLRADGTLDPSFGEGRGYLLAHGRLGGDGGISSLQALPDGGFIALGDERAEPGPREMVALRYDAAGHADPTFGRGGEAMIQGLEPARAEISDLSPGSDGGLVAAAEVKGRLGLLRIAGRTGGSGLSWRTSTGPPLGSDFFAHGHTLAREPGGGYLVGGYSVGKGIVTRWLSKGRLDPGFGDGGVVEVPFLRKVLALQVTADGSILVAGFGPGERTALVQLGPDGTPDESFAGGGVARLPIGTDRSHTMALALGKDGAILVGGGDVYLSRVVELTVDGRRVASFGRDGVASGLPLPESLTAIRLDRHGRIVLTGVHNKQASITRLLPHGAPDLTFGHGGSVRTEIAHSVRSDFTDLRIEPDGDIVAVGERRFPCAFQCSVHVPLVVRYRPDGSLDRAFAERGVWSHRIGQSAGISAVALAQGRIVSGGWQATEGHGREPLLLSLAR